jgi:hypothetical protein
MKHTIVSITPVRFGQWTVQASVMDNDSICVILNHDHNLRCFVRFFDDDRQASVFVKSIINMERTTTHPDSPFDK